MDLNLRDVINDLTFTDVFVLIGDWKPVHRFVAFQRHQEVVLPFPLFTLNIQFAGPKIIS